MGRTTTATVLVMRAAPVIQSKRASAERSSYRRRAWLELKHAAQLGSGATVRGRSARAPMYATESTTTAMASSISVAAVCPSPSVAVMGSITTATDGSTSPHASPFSPSARPSIGVHPAHRVGGRRRVDLGPTDFGAMRPCGQGARSFLGGESSLREAWAQMAAERGSVTTHRPILGAR